MSDRAAQRTLDNAIRAIERWRSISAKTRQSVLLFGKRLVGSGEYLEQRTDGRVEFRFELKMQVGEEPKTWLEVSDGRYLWRSETYRGDGTAERIDLARVAQALHARDSLDGLGPEMDLCNAGGLYKILRRLRSEFRFTSLTESRLSGQTAVLRLEGISRAYSPGVSMPDQRAPFRWPGLPNADAVSPPVPHFVALYLGKDDLFPDRIEYSRRVPGRSTGLDGLPDEPMVTMDLFEVTFNVPINRDLFKFSPGKLKYSDQTDRLLQRLRPTKP